MEATTNQRRNRLRRIIAGTSAVALSALSFVGTAWADPPVVVCPPGQIPVCPPNPVCPPGTVPIYPGQTIVAPPVELAPDLGQPMSDLLAPKEDPMQTGDPESEVVPPAPGTASDDVTPPTADPQADASTDTAAPQTDTPNLDSPVTNLDNAAQQFDASNFARQGQAGAAAGALALADTPAMMGDFGGFLSSDGGFLAPVIIDEGILVGTPVGGEFTFDVGAPGGPDLSTGGLTGSGGTFLILEPTGPTDATTSAQALAGSPDYLGGFAVPTGNPNEFRIQYAYAQRIFAPIRPSASVGRLKLAENTSPIPRDRIFGNYSYFDDVPFFDDIGVNRFTPGFEKTFGDKNFSFEFRAPMAITLNSTVDPAAPDIDNYEFGDLYMTLKALLYQNENFALSAGLSFTAPTADDTATILTSGTGSSFGSIFVENQTVNLAPYVGFTARSNNTFAQVILQVTTDVSGNPVRFGSEDAEISDRLFDTDFLFFDVQLGHWMYRKKGRKRSGITGLALVSELHYNQSLESTQEIDVAGLLGSPDSLFLADGRENISVLNAMIGLTTVVGDKTSISTAYGTPIGNGSDHMFDGEFRLLINRYF